MSLESDIEWLQKEIVHNSQYADHFYPGWWWHAAYDSLVKKRFHYFSLRGVDKLYLARFWLTPPQKQENGDLNSSSSTLLHYFGSGDDAGLMHDHPYDFRTLILNGGYTEQIPSGAWWHDRCNCPNPRLIDGPIGLKCYRTDFVAGQELEHDAIDLHAALDPLPDTWTMVTTGPRVRKWGFHPPGETWISHDDYFAQKAAS